MHPKTALFLFFSLFITTAQAQTEPANASSKELVFASDTQAPMWVETLFLKANNNRSATKKIFDELADRQPSSVFLLGDVVNLGYSNKQWKPMDKYLQALRDKGITVDAVLGNHEVMGQAEKGERKFQKRFPDHVKTGYVVVKDSIAVVLLNSNFGALTAEENQQQQAWYKTALAQLDADPSILFIISGCHHSPYTNSKIVSCSKNVQQAFVPSFLAYKKSCLFLTGHCHDFEHYQKEGKDFFVIGGGGGLHQPLKVGKDALPDLAANYKPQFHYLVVKRDGNNLQVTSRELKDDFNSFDDGLIINIKGANITTDVAKTESHATGTNN
ncbi:MAG: metallophosphoesterase [Chitinophagaceae bacterium]